MAMGILKGLGSLMRRNKGRGPNVKLTPEEVAQRKLLPEHQSFDDMIRMSKPTPGTAMRAKQVGDETMGMIRDSVMKMDLPADKKLEAFRGAMETLNKLPPAQLAKANPAQLSMNIIKMAGAGGAGFIGGSMMEGAAREGRLPEMIQDSFLVRPEFRGMRDTGPFGKGFDSGVRRTKEDFNAALEALGVKTARVPDEDVKAIQEMMDATQMGYDMPDPEPGLEEFSFLSPEDLLLNELFRD